MDILSQKRTSINNVLESYSSERGSVFLSNVFTFMFLALGLSAVIAYLFSHNSTLLSYLVNPATGMRNGLGTIVMFLPLAFVLVMSFGYQKLSAPIMTLLFFIYAAINGISFSFILLSFASSSVVSCFASSALMFGISAAFGFITKKDLSTFGRIMMMGLIGIIVASLINLFLHNGPMDYIISFVGVAVFTGLTAYDVQKIKNIGRGIDENGDAISGADVKKLSIMGALNLYLDFINLFLMILRLFGNRK